MAIQDTDLFLVTRGSESFKCEAQNFTTNVRSDDLLLVNRSGDSYHVLGGELPTKLKDDDLMLVNRAGTSYKATGAEVLDYIEPGSGLTTLYTGTFESTFIRTGIDYTSGGLIWILDRTEDSKQNVGFIASNPSETWFLNSDNYMQTIATNVESVSTDGFTVGPQYATNKKDNEFVAWSWPKLPGVFDVVSYTGDAKNSNSTQDVPHSLGTPPGFIIVRKTQATKSDWLIYHCGANQGRNAYNYTYSLNNSDYADFTNKSWGADPGTSTFSVKGNSGNGANNSDGTPYTAWLWPKSSPSVACGSYTGDGNVGHIITLPSNFQAVPQWILTKRVSGGSSADRDWIIYDNKRGFNGVAARAPLFPGASSVERTLSTGVAFLGKPGNYSFNPEGNDTNQKNNEFLYMAIASPV